MIAALNNRPNAMERKIISSIRHVNDRYRQLGCKSAKWTRAIKNEVGNLGKKLGYMVYGAGCKFYRNGEWLFDLVWSKEKGDIVYKLPLIMESEWNPRDILWDFSKLVIARADIRLMIFWEKNERRAEDVIKKLIDQIIKFRGTMAGDCYLFSYWTDKPDKLFFKSYVIKKGY